MVTVINRPLGHKLTDAELTAEVFDNSGEALFITTFAHGLVDGNYVYVQSDIETYNGYKYVDSIAYNEFKLRESAAGDYVEFKQSIAATYRISVLQHGYLSISQPIVYELESDLWPVNQPEEAYTPRIVDSFADAEGYTQLNLSAPLTSPFALDFIELLGVGDLAGVYQIITVLQPWSVIINLQYDAGNSFVGYEVVKYYNNYCINVDIYSGLGVEHPWYNEKPFELAATLRFTPDANGRCKFSISDILKGYLETRNNLTLPTLPNNLDFMTAFYIAYYESYDSSDGTEIMTLESAPTSDRDTFEGHAINSDMPFKSVYISHMSEYLNEDTYLAKWLLLQSRPVAVVGYFFDLSFINHIPRIDILINVNKSLNGLVLATEVITLTNPGVGVLRVPLTIESGYDEYCVFAHTLGVSASGGVPVTSLAALADWTNLTFGWTLGANPSISVNGNGGVSNWIRGAIATVVGFDYEFTVEFEIAVTGSSTPTSAILFALMDNVGNTLDSVGFNYVTAGVKTETFTLNPSGAGTHLAMFITNNTPFDTKNYDIQSAVYNSPGAPPDDSIPAQVITETICITVIEECDSTFIPDDDIRLTEDGDFRILE